MNTERAEKLKIFLAALKSSKKQVSLLPRLFLFFTSYTSDSENSQNCRFWRLLNPHDLNLYDDICFSNPNH